MQIITEFRILNYDSSAQKTFRVLKQKRVRVGTQDMRIASITLAVNGILLTRNRQDFEKIPKLRIEDWSI